MSGLLKNLAAHALNIRPTLRPAARLRSAAGTIAAPDMLVNDDFPGSFIQQDSLTPTPNAAPLTTSAQPAPMADFKATQDSSHEQYRTEPAENAKEQEHANEIPHRPITSALQDLPHDVAHASRNHPVHDEADTVSSPRITLTAALHQTDPARDQTDAMAKPEVGLNGSPRKTDLLIDTVSALPDPDQGLNRLPRTTDTQRNADFAARPATAHVALTRLAMPDREQTSRSALNQVPDVHIHIGRVELTAVTAPLPRRQERNPATKQQQSLNDYLQRRSGKTP